MDQQARMSAHIQAMLGRLLFPRPDPGPPSINDLIASLHNFEVVSEGLGDGYASTYRFLSNVFSQIRDQVGASTELEAHAALTTGLVPTETVAAWIRTYPAELSKCRDLKDSIRNGYPDLARQFD